MPRPVLPPSDDPRDVLAQGSSALRAIADLVGDAGRADRQFSAVGPQELYDLLDLTVRHVERASDELQGYVPRV